MDFIFGIGFAILVALFILVTGVLSDNKKNAERQAKGLPPIRRAFAGRIRTTRTIIAPPSSRKSRSVRPSMSIAKPGSVPSGKTLGRDGRKGKGR